MSVDALRAFFVVLSMYAILGSGCGNERRASEDGDGGVVSDAGEDAASEPLADAGAPDAEVLSPFDAWREVQSALRMQPDHRVARAEALVKQGDPEQLYLFVRDQIATYPPSTSGFDGVLNRQRWGLRGTLRGGAGTPREKAELLVSLYRRAGFEAEVVRGAADPDCLTGETMLLGARPAPEPISFSEAQNTRWRRALGGKPPAPRTLIDPTGARAEALSQRLLDKLPAELSSPFDFTLKDIPLVRVKLEGEWVLANPLAKSAPFGTGCVTGGTTPTSGPYAAANVYVRLQAARADAPFERFTLLERTYESEEVVGRKIHLSFVPPVRTESLLRMRAEDVTSFVPLLAVAGPDMTQEERDALAISGDVVTVQGDHYTVDEASGVLSVNGHPLAPTMTDPTQVARVDRISASAQASAFPHVTLRVSAVDSGGSSVPALSSDAFTITEGGEPVPFQVVQNQAPPPRVVLLFDVSTSVPAEFREANAVQLAEDRGSTTADLEVTRDMLEDVRAVLLGRISIAVEAAPPSPSMLLDDWIADKLSLEPLWEAVESQDSDSVIAELAKGFSVTPGKLPLAQPPLFQGDPTTALTFEDGLRVATLVQRARLGAPFRRELDLFPLARFATASADPRDAFVRTLRSTASLAVMEAELMTGESTLEALDGAPLTLVNPGGARAQPDLTADQRLQWAALEQPFNQSYQLLVPVAPGPFWAIDETTGTVIGILADGSGGAAETCEAFDAANRMISGLGLVGGLAGASVGGWVALAKWEVRMVTIATLVISGEGGGFDAGDFTNPAAEMGCGILDDALGGALSPYGGYGMLMGALDTAGIDTGAPGLCDSLGFGMSGGAICGG